MLKRLAATAATAAVALPLFAAPAHAAEGVVLFRHDLANNPVTVAVDPAEGCHTVPQVLPGLPSAERAKNRTDALLRFYAAPDCHHPVGRKALPGDVVNVRGAMSFEVIDLE
ncbi:hypothetical protein [Nocardiopsis sp. FIRDI 009]|uniref:hypothetical protein n=1 Tax=Nocardiopsis sp. FIRDI 009 TaxID=714197 RepID=UPI000E25DAD7|nr:hypothetical protein [Nocardiopsis sp. FIRDI 009]